MLQLKNKILIKHQILIEQKKLTHSSHKKVLFKIMFLQIFHQNIKINLTHLRSNPYSKQLKKIWFKI